MDENNLNIRNNFLNIKVVSNRNGEPVCTDIMKKLVDFTDDEKRCLLLKGEWYRLSWIKLLFAFSWYQHIC